MNNPSPALLALKRPHSLLVSIVGALLILEGFGMLAFGVGIVLFVGRLLLRDFGIVPAGLEPLDPEEHVNVQPWIEVGHATTGALLLGLLAVAVLIGAIPLLAGRAVLSRKGRRLALLCAAVGVLAAGGWLAGWFLGRASHDIVATAFGFIIVGYTVAKVVVLLCARAEFADRSPASVPALLPTASATGIRQGNA